MNTESLTRFFQFLWSSLKVVQTLVLGGLSLLLIAAVIFVISEQQKPSVPDGGALVLNLSGTLVEQKTAVDPALLLRGGDVPQEVLVKDVIDVLALARDDKKIGSLVLALDKLGGGLLPKVERIAVAIADFRSSGKKVVAVGNEYSHSAILLAAQADEVLLNPEGGALPEGFGMWRTYYKSLLENYDVSVNLFKVGKYKSAAEPFFRDSMSAEDQEARLALLNNWWGAYTSAIESARDLPEGSLDAVLQDFPKHIRQANGDVAQASVDMGLVDRLITDDELRDYLVELAGESEEEGKEGEYRRISYQAYLAATRKPEKQKDNRVAVITAVGTIVDGSAKAGTIGSESLTKLIRKARKNEHVKAIVLRVDSGGGSKTASEIIRRELESVQQAGIPVISSMGSVAASGGYWISATADEIWAQPTTITGSIGIFGLIPTFEKTLARYGIYGDGVGTTPMAGGVSLARGITPVYGDVIQTVIEAGYQQFLSTVGRGRNMSTEEVDEVAQGRVWSGDKALELGLVDHLGGLEQAIEAAARLAELDDYSTWYLQPELTTQEKLLQQLLVEAGMDLTASSIDPVSQLLGNIRRELNFLEQLNDPRGAYVICAVCPVDQ